MPHTRHRLAPVVVPVTAWRRTGAASPPNCRFRSPRSNGKPCPDEQILDGVVEAVNQSTVSAQTAGRVEDHHGGCQRFRAARAPRSSVSATSSSAPDLEPSAGQARFARPALTRPAISARGEARFAKRPSTSGFATSTKDRSTKAQRTSRRTPRRAMDAATARDSPPLRSQGAA
jgi:hypothetical protein